MVTEITMGSQGLSSKKETQQLRKKTTAMNLNQTAILTQSFNRFVKVVSQPLFYVNGHVEQC